MSEVSLLKQKKDSISDTIQKCLELIEFNYNKDAHNILIKPNMCYYWDSTTGHTTDPLFVEEIVKILRTKYSNDVDISVIESDASAMKCKYAFKMLGYEKMSERNKINLFNLSEMEKEKNSVTVNDKLYEFDIPIIIKNADLLINIPKIKYMNSNIKMTCALKNIFGCNPNHKKYIYHKDINEVIVALNKLIKTDLCIVDGIVVHGIKTKKIDLIMASKDPVAIDTAAAKIIGVNPNTINYLKLAEKEKLGKMDPIVKGESINDWKKIYPTKTFQSKSLTFGYQMIKLFKLNKRMGLE